MCIHVSSRSYDSQVEDAQNPFPRADTPLRKEAYQTKRKKPGHLDSQATLILSPIRPVKRVKSEDIEKTEEEQENKEDSDTPPGLDPDLKRALRRPQTVDLVPAEVRKSNAKSMQRNLSKELKDARDTPQRAANSDVDQTSTPSPATSKKKKSAASSNPSPDSDSSKKSPESSAASKKSPGSSTASKKSPASSTASQTPSPKAKAKAKTKAKAKAKANNSKPQDDENMKDHATARSSTEPMPEKPKTTSPEKPPTKDKPTTEPANENETETPNLSEKKKEAHKLYMRLYRSIQGLRLRSIEMLYAISAFRKGFEVSVLVRS